MMSETECHSRKIAVDDANGNRMRFSTAETEKRTAQMILELIGTEASVEILHQLDYASLSPPSLEPFPHDQRKHRQRSYGISPPPTQHGVQPQADKGRRGEPCTNDGLVRVRPQRPAPETSCYAELRSGQEGHHDQRERRERDADRTRFGAPARQQEPGGVGDDVDPEREQQEPRPAGGPPLNRRTQGRGT